MARRLSTSILISTIGSGLALGAIAGWAMFTPPGIPAAPPTLVETAAETAAETITEDSAVPSNDENAVDPIQDISTDSLVATDSLTEKSDILGNTQAGSDTTVEKRIPAKRTRRSVNSRGTGKLTVNARPWARVLLDGKEIASETPLRARRTSVGQHTITVTHPSGMRLSRKINIKANLATIVFVDVAKKSIDVR